MPPPTVSQTLGDYTSNALGHEKRVHIVVVKTISTFVCEMVITESSGEDK